MEKRLKFLESRRGRNELARKRTAAEPAADDRAWERVLDGSSKRSAGVAMHFGVGVEYMNSFVRCSEWA